MKVHGIPFAVWMVCVSMSLGAAVGSPVDGESKQAAKPKRWQTSTKKDGAFTTITVDFEGDGRIDQMNVHEMLDRFRSRFWHWSGMDSNGQWHALMRGTNDEPTVTESWSRCGNDRYAYGQTDTYRLLKTKGKTWTFGGYDFFEITTEPISVVNGEEETVVWNEPTRRLSVKKQYDKTISRITLTSGTERIEISGFSSLFNLYHANTWRFDRDAMSPDRRLIEVVFVEWHLPDEIQKVTFCRGTLDNPETIVLYGNGRNGKFTSYTRILGWPGGGVRRESDFSYDGLIDSVIIQETGKPERGMYGDDLPDRRYKLPDYLPCISVDRYLDIIEKASS